MEKVLIHYSEIGLKGKNLPFFEKKLIVNIMNSLESNNLKPKKIFKLDKRILCEFSQDQEITDMRNKISYSLKNVFGIKNFCFVQESQKDIKNVKKLVEDILKKWKSENIKKVSFKTKRSDKSFEMTSIEINKELGDIVKNLGLKVDYSNSERCIFIEVTSKKMFIFTEKISGLGGLPVSTEGRVLCLLSGGIDSPVASWLMMKRGCGVDFLQFHAYPKNKNPENEKIEKTIKILNKYQNKSRLYLLPYSRYEISTQGKIPSKFDLILFRNYMIKVAEQIALKKKYSAIVTGDSLGQVASQTIENMDAASQNISIPIFRPLLTYDKQEIIDLAKKIGTYNESIKNFKDCCSIISRNPSTRVNKEKFKRYLEKLDVNNIAKESVQDLEEFSI